MSSYLEERIRWYDDNYRSGNALISDAQFDQLENNLKRVSPNCDYFTNKKALPLPSLPKDQIQEFIEGLLPDTRLIIEPKIDGCAIALQYRDGILEKAISRKGTDCTNKISAVPDVPSNIKIKGLFQVRGELFNPSEYERPTYSQRQAGGYLRAADSKSDHLSFCSFQIINGRLNQHDSLKYLKKLGFTIPEYKSLNFTSQVEMYRKQWSDKKLFTNYPTDGIVVKINSRKLQLIREKSIGVYPHWAMAIKY
ncbi:MULTISPECIES: NAD-dependent DNA ligase [unclassified Prochlorococcus]|jgi:DNA ligase (NAD+)|uniref:NAD-dependent DNA ligase n=1 Tax=unclassified Prochlorococcus TaxID=2627481 RepID=UPI00097CD4B7|nr:MULTISPECIES: NAD-dependent DNA ligase [unclassified Prochlorococcus]AQL31334.1 NAD-dependent DNA ligase [Prochlorococcus sp. RS50]AQL31724.1 NAD-dependent DNA ligase [Prochlorococcus sp. RS01]AQL34676.1 NAD-dependent DNA ligase [Prochlorococcus sp. RS04]|tara:strand:- start:159 stop:914 length:756 start_codon:yes stop_codon:yes gene_type:complete